MFWTWNCEESLKVQICLLASFKKCCDVNELDTVKGDNLWDSADLTV